MKRSEVKSYLEAQRITYGPISWGGSGDAWSYETRIGQEPGDRLVCDSWAVYISLDFSKSRGDQDELIPSPDDALKEIRIKRVGDCL